MYLHESRIVAGVETWMLRSGGGVKAKTEPTRKVGKKSRELEEKERDCGERKDSRVPRALWTTRPAYCGLSSSRLSIDGLRVVQATYEDTTQQECRGDTIMILTGDVSAVRVL